MTYYNTTHLSGSDLKQSVSTAITQDSIILNHFKNHPGTLFTPFDLLNLFDFNTPITSVRRSVTNLKKDGLLEKTAEKRMGVYGKLNYCWKLKC